VSQFTAEQRARVWEQICDLIANQRLSLLAICGRAENPHPPLLEGAPNYRTARRWIVKYEDLRQQYLEAVEARTHAQVEEIIAIADEPPKHVTIISEDGDRITRVDNGYVQHQRNRVDARKWVAARMLPKVYGDRTAHGILGKDGELVDPPVVNFGFPNGGPGVDPQPKPDSGTEGS
jgi:hypothetical protein